MRFTVTDIPYAVNVLKSHTPHPSKKHGIMALQTLILKLDGEIANSIGPDQTAPKEQSDRAYTVSNFSLSLHCL